MDQLSADAARSFVALTSEGIWRFTTTPAIPTTLPVDEQVELIWRRGMLAECNDALARMYGHASADDFIGSSLLQFIPERDRTNREFLEAFVRGGYRVEGFETVETTTEGSKRHFLKNVVGVVRDGLLVEAWGSQTDVTERQRREQQAREAQAMDVVGRLAGSVAHDFNNLLTTILASAEMLSDVLPGGSTVNGDVEEIRRSARRGAELTRQLLALSRQQFLAPRAVDVNVLVRRIEPKIRTILGEGVKLGLTQQHAPTVAHVDGEELEQTLLHVATHAAGAMISGRGAQGAFTLEVKHERVDRARPAVPDEVPAGDYAAIRVAHSGTLVSPDSAPSLFDPFAGPDSPSLPSRLAMATVYGFVLQSGGALDFTVTSSGVAFTMYFPLTSLPAAGPERPMQLIAEEERSRTILLADDEPTVRLLMKRVLVRAGYAVLVASRGDEALSIARAYPRTIDALVTDVIMPGMGGGELSRSLRRERPSIKVLHVSGYTAGALRQHEALDDGAAFLQKPFAPATLLAKVQEILEN